MDIVPVVAQAMEHPDLLSFMQHFHRVIKSRVDKGDKPDARTVLIQIEREVLQAFIPESVANNELPEFITAVVGPGPRIVRCLYIAPIPGGGYQFVGDDPTEGLLIGTCGRKAAQLKIVRPITSHALMPVRHGRIS